MRFFFLLCSPLLALDYTWTLTPVATATGTVQVAQVNFDCGAGSALPSLPAGKFAAPYAGGTKLAAWQSNAESWCANGSLERAVVSFKFSGAADTGAVIQWRADDNPCHVGNRAACDAAGLDQAGMLAFNGGTWTASLTLTANPQGSTTARTFDARAILNANASPGDRWRYWLRGPVINVIQVSDISTNRADDFGWKEHVVAILTQQVSGTASTTVVVNDASQWASLARPFKISVANGITTHWENMWICYVSGNTLTVGNSNGASEACANANGRGIDGTTAQIHQVNANGTRVILHEAGNLMLNSVIGPGTADMTLVDASSINAVTLLQIGGGEIVRACNRSGNTLSFHPTAAWGCAANSAGRAFRGTSSGFGGASHYWAQGVPVRIIDDVTDRWRDAPSDQFKSLHPTALIAFPDGWAGVNVQFRVEDGWTDRLQNQEYDVSINSGSYTRTRVKHAARQTVFYPVYDDSTPGLRGLWVGTKPPVVEYDFDLRWCVSIGLCANDLDLNVTTSNVSTMLDNTFGSEANVAPSWTGGSNSKCNADTVAILDGTDRGSYGHLSRVTDGTGARADIGLDPKATAMAKQAWKLTGSVSRTMREMAGQIAACNGLMPIHHLEHRNSLTFCNGGGYTANPNDKACTINGNQSLLTFGKFPSLIAYPSMNPGYQNNSTPSVTVVGHLDTNGIVAFIPGAWSHMPNNTYWDWITSGNLMFEELLQSHAGNVVIGNNPFPGTPTGTGAGAGRQSARGNFAAVNTSDGARTRAWPLRDMFFGWYASRSGSAYREYFDWALRMNFAVLEGTYNFTGGSFYVPCQTGYSPSVLADITYSPWCFGRTGRGLDAVMHPLWPSEPAMGYGPQPSTIVGRARNAQGNFMFLYELSSYALIARKLPSVAPFSREYTGRMALIRVLGSGVNPWSISSYQSANDSCQPEGVDVANCDTQSNPVGTVGGFSTPAAWNAANATATQTMTGPDMTSGTQARSLLVLNALKINPRASYSTFTARRTLEFWEQIPGRNTLQNMNTDPSWASNIWERPPVTVTPGDTSARITSSTLWPSCKVAVQSTPFGIMDDSTHSAGAMIGQRLEHIVTGLTASTTYYYMVTCGEIGRTVGTFTTTASAGGAVTKTISLAPPANRGIATARIAYGASASLGSATSAVSCATSCSIDVPAQTGRGLNWRAEYFDGSSNLVARSQINTDIP